MSITKKFVKNNTVCKVTFKLPKALAKSAKSVHIVGEFNNWSMFENPMKANKDGSYTTTIDLESGKEYQFRYLIDETRWENELQADKSVPTIYGDSENSVLVL